MKILRLLLYPFSIIYDAVTSIRNVLFNKGIFKQTTFKMPIIIVGNLSVGGTGKTPQIEYLIRLLKDRFEVSVLSRGYKRKTKGFVLLNKNHTALDVGDEPLQFYKKFSNINVAVNENRVEGVSFLMDKKSPDVILLDDAYQHRKIKGSFYILLTKFNDLFINDYLLPAGNLRESRSGAKRTDIIVVTKCPDNVDDKRLKIIRNKFKKYNKTLFFTSISYGRIKSENNLITINQLKKYQVLLITGIANPKPLVTYLNNNTIDFKHLKFTDHHHFSTSELKVIHHKFDALKADKKIILTTEKDYIRLVDKIDNLYYIEINIRFLEDKKQDFNDLILDHIQQNRC